MGLETTGVSIEGITGLFVYMEGKFQKDLNSQMMMDIVFLETINIPQSLFFHFI